MKRLLILAAAVLITASALAEKPIQRTIIVRDGKVITDAGRAIEIEEILGGSRAYLGVSTIDISPELRQHYGASSEAGVLVASVAKDSPAEKAGVRIGDIILSVDGREISSLMDLRAALREKKSGDSARLELLRNRARQTVVATVAEREGARIVVPGDLEGLRDRLNSGEWRGRVLALSGGCEDLQARIRELESRLRDLEKKLQK